MLFRRKKPVGWLGQARRFMWPRKGFVRPFLYHAKCTMRIRDNAHAIALGVACGAFVSFTPLFGFHILLALALAWLLSGNMVAAAVGTIVGNPLTFPPILLATYRTGTFLLGQSPHKYGAAENFLSTIFHADAPVHEVLIRMWEPLVLPMLVGGIPLGLLVAGVFYSLVRPAVTSFQAGRAKRKARAERARANIPFDGSARV